MRLGLAAASLAAGLAACVSGGSPFPPGAKPHGPYLDRTQPGFVVRAAFVEDITVISVQGADGAVEPSPDALARSRELLGAGAVTGPDPLAVIAREAPRFEASALTAAESPGWCRDSTRWTYLPPTDTPIDHSFGIRGTYNGSIAAFVFAGQCR